MSAAGPFPRGLVALLEAEGGELGDPAPAPLVAQIHATAELEFGCGLPDDYRAFLELANGALWNGLALYGADSGAGPIPGLLERNRTLRSYAELGRRLILGDVDDTLFAHDGADGAFLRLDQTSLDEIERHGSVGALLTKAVEELL